MCWTCRRGASGAPACGSRPASLATASHGDQGVSRNAPTRRRPMPHSPAHFMTAALQIAADGLERGELPIGAVVVLGDEIIASAHTAERAERRLLVHAELLALDAADRLTPFPGRRRDVRLFTTLEPCLMCLGAAMSFGLGEIHYALKSP